MNFGKTIQELRKQKDITQEELAAQLGVTAAAVSKWENNYTLPDILMLCALADFFDVSTDKLLGRVQEGRYAAIAAENGELRSGMEALAMQYGFTSLYLSTDTQSAIENANSDSRVSLLLIACEDARFSIENMDIRKGVQTIVSLGGSHKEILHNIEMMLRG